MDEEAGPDTDSHGVTVKGKIRVGPAGMKALNNNDVPKGDPFVIARTAAESGVHETPGLVPESHSSVTEDLTLNFDLRDESVIVSATVDSPDHDSVETQAMTAVSLALLNLYDLLKPIEDEVEIGEVGLD